MVSTIKLGLKIIFIVVAVWLLIIAFIPEKIKVDLVEVTRADLLITLEGEGKTRIHDIYTISAPIDGRITRIESEPGDIVRAGKTVIANMYPANPQFLDKRSETQARADVEGAKAALALSMARVKQAKAQLEFDQLDYQRTQELFSKKSVSKASLQRAALRLETLQAELETAMSNQAVMTSRLEAAKARLLQPVKSVLDDKSVVDHCTICIHSPVDGRVLRILHKSEGIVPMGTPLVEIGDPNDLEVIIEMLSTNVVKIRTGDTALIKRWGGGQDINAQVRLIEPSGYTKISALGIEEQRVNVVLSFTDPIEKWQSLGDAFRVEAAIIIEQAEDVLQLPLSALFRDNEVWSVFKMQEGRAVLQNVVVGRRNDIAAEILAGVNEGDQILVHPGNKILPGVRVEKR